MNSSDPQAGMTPPPSHREPFDSIWEIYFPRHVGHDHDRKAIYVASFPDMIFFWPTILVFFVSGFLQAISNISPSVLGWLSIFVLFFNMLVLVQEFDQKKFIILLLVFVAGLLGVWIIDLYGFTFLQRLTNWFFGYQPIISTSAYFIAGFLLLGLFVWALASPLFNYWRLEHNEFVHFVQPIGRESSIARVGLTVNKEVPDVLECILTWGGGTLIIKKDGQTLATIPNVPFLTRRMEAIERMLSETRITLVGEKNA